MKKIAVLLAALLFAVMCAAPACAVEEGNYAWREWTIEVTKVEENPMFVPVQMKEDEYTVAVYITVAEELWQDEAESAELYAEAVLFVYGLRRKGAPRRFLPALLGLAACVLIIAEEFALDKTDLPNLLIYACMALELAVLGFAEHRTHLCLQG